MTPLPLLNSNFKINKYINIFFYSFFATINKKKSRPRSFPYSPSTTTAICFYAIWAETYIRIFFFMWSLVVGVDIYILLSTYDFLIQLVSGFTTLGTISWEKLVKRMYFFSLFCLMINFCFVSLLLYLRGSKLKFFLWIIKNNSDFIRI